MNSRTGILIATIGVILSMCLGLVGGALAGFYVSQVSPRAVSSTLPFAPDVTLPNVTSPSQPQPSFPNPGSRGPGRTLPGAGVSGAVVMQVTPGSPAEQGGVQVGDVITAVDGQAVDSDHPLNELIQGKKPGARIELRVQRGTGVETLPITLGANPNETSAPYLGLRFTMFDRQPTPSGSSG